MKKNRLVATGFIALALASTMSLCACTSTQPANTNQNTNAATNVSDKPSNANTAEIVPESPVDGYRFDRHDSKGDHFVNDATGAGYYINADGTLEMMGDGGVILLDENVDGIFDRSSEDGGASWKDIADQGLTWK